MPETATHKRGRTIDIAAAADAVGVVRQARSSRRSFVPPQELSALQYPTTRDERELVQHRPTQQKPQNVPLPRTTTTQRETLLGLFGRIVFDTVSLLSPEVEAWWTNLTTPSQERYGFGLAWLSIGAAFATAGSIPVGGGLAVFGGLALLHARAEEKRR